MNSYFSSKYINMKKLILAIAFVSATFVASAQEENSFEAKTIELINMTNGQQFDIILEPVINMVPEENKEAFKKELNAKMEGLYAQIATIYMESFTEEDVDKMLEFYHSPVGQKLVAETPNIMKKSMQVGQQLGMELQPLIQKYTK